MYDQVICGFHLTRNFKVALADWKCNAWLNNSLESQVQGSNKGPRKCTESLFGSFEHVKPAVKDIRNVTPRLLRIASYSVFWDENSEANSLLGPSCPFKSWVITGFIVITACFLKGQSSQGSNPPVSTHINGLIGLFTPSQNLGLSLTEMLSPQSPLRLNTREMHDVYCKVEPSLPFALIHIVVIPVFFFLSPLFCFFQSCCVCFVPPARSKRQWV